MNGGAPDTTVVSAPDFLAEEDEGYSEPEPPPKPNTSFEGSDLDGSGIQQATTAEDQLLSEASVAEKLPVTMEIDRHQSVNGIGDEYEWPNEDGLEGAPIQHISEFKLLGDSMDEERLDKDSAINTDDAERKRGKAKKKKPTKTKKLPKPLDPEAPTIFILDSLSSGAHSRTFVVLREYLEEEARQKKQWNIIGRNINGIYAKVLLYLRTESTTKLKDFYRCPSNLTGVIVAYFSSIMLSGFLIGRKSLFKTSSAGTLASDILNQQNSLVCDKSWWN